mmetsp:Transcript_12789/g.28299  ORF Transcript_12789/g.28299 Transcript_12789/m.28299 type:complete len:276 (-) Transcript_12789:107-934(-)
MLKVLSAPVVRFGLTRTRSNNLFSRRAHLSDISGQVESEAALSTASSAAGASSTTVKEIARHGLGDSVIVLDVGGKEFKTLRSTIASNRVLSSLVSRAEKNAELTQGGKAVFIDRDPTHFGLILQHLRNTADGLSYNSMSRYIPGKHASKIPDTTVRLPTDRGKLRDVYMESTFYDVQELRNSACGQSMLAWFFTNIRGSSSNPFDEAAKLMARLKRGLIATVGLVGVSNTGSILDLLPESVKAAIIPEVKILEELTGDREDSEKAKKKNNVDKV